MLLAVVPSNVLFVHGSLVKRGFAVGEPVQVEHLQILEFSEGEWELLEAVAADVEAGKLFECAEFFS